MTPARIAVIGCGNVSRMHFDAYARNPERVDVVAACDPVTELRTDVAVRYGVARTVATVDELLAQAGTDFEISVVCTPTPVRRAVVEQLAGAGKHVFVEKPFADSFQEAAGMVAAADRAGVRIAVNQNFRYHYPFDIARGLIAEGRIGSVISVLHQDLMLRQDQGWRTRTRRHALSVMGVHWLDGLRWMLQDEATSVHARQRSSSLIDSAGETDITATLTFAGGAIATIFESFSCPFPRTETVIIGEQGTIVLAYPGATLYAPDGSQTETLPTAFPGPAKPGATLRNLESLASAITTGEDPANSGRDNLQTIALLDSAYRSAETGEVVTPMDPATR